MMMYSFRLAFYLFVAALFSSCASSSHGDLGKAFFSAVKTDNASLVNEALGRGFDPNTADEQGQVGLFLAMREGSAKVAAVLLAHPATRLDATNTTDETPLMMAALRGRPDWVQRLLDRGAQVNRPGWTPLHYAATGPEPKCVAHLLDRGAAIDAPSPNRSTPLMMAARYGSDEAADLLLRRGASPKLRNDRGMNASDFAKSAGRDALAARLEAAAR